MPQINTSRSANVDYRSVAGDTFLTPLIRFTIDRVAEDFTGCSFKMQVRQNNAVRKELTNIAGIIVADNTLQYYLSASDISDLDEGVYQYDVQKSIGGVITTIQHGNIELVKQVTI